MIEIYRDRDYSKVGMIQGLLEDAGIRTLLRNRNAVSMTTEIPIPIMFPNICLLNSTDKEQALELIDVYLNMSRVAAENTEKWRCSKCDETNDDNFSECWSCQTDRTHKSPAK